ncbi:MAG: aryl-sulfate sulfotransferase [Nanoarchaeota archaeon]
MKKKILVAVLFFAFIISCTADQVEEIEERDLGNVLFTSMDTGGIYLIDDNGNIVHQWTGLDARFARFLENGTLLVIANDSSVPGKNESKGDAILREVAWNGTVLWAYTNPNIHHDMIKLPTGNVLALLREKMSSENVERISGHNKIKAETFWSDVIIEIDHQTKEIVWEWHSQNELAIEKYTFNEKNNEWTHANAIEFLADGNTYNGKESFLISFRHLNTIMIIDKTTGDVMWEFGQGELIGQHNPTLLENGNILVFDNGRQQSRVVEIDPNTNTIVWEYTHDDFYAFKISGAQRLSNGNTLITDGPKGYIFEVTPAKKIVWEYTNPYHDKKGNGEIFRAYKIDTTIAEEILTNDES